jgi:hypothetical protein
MAKKVALVGHCGPDSSYLRMTITRSIKDAQDGVDLILFNRELGYGFSEEQGVKYIAKLRGTNGGGTKMMLVSNYPDAQAAAVAAGALPGFGKRELGTPRVTELLKAAVE